MSVNGRYQREHDSCIHDDGSLRFNGFVGGYFILRQVDTRMKVVEAYNIIYDTDGLSVKLPKKIKFEVTDDFNVEYDLADMISDETGWCVFGFDYRFLS